MRNVELAAAHAELAAARKEVARLEAKIKALHAKVKYGNYTSAQREIADRVRKLGFNVAGRTLADVLREFDAILAGASEADHAAAERLLGCPLRPFVVLSHEKDGEQLP